MLNYGKKKIHRKQQNPAKFLQIEIQKWVLSWESVQPFEKEMTIQETKIMKVKNERGLLCLLYME